MILRDQREVYCNGDDGNSHPPEPRIFCHRVLNSPINHTKPPTTAGTGRKEGSKTPPQSASFSSSLPDLLEMSGALVAGTLSSASPSVDASAKADALTLIPFLRPCLTRKAKDYGHSVPNAGQGDYSNTVLPASYAPFIDPAVPIGPGI